MSDQDVFVNVVGGVKVTETSADLALLMSLVSSLRDRPLPQDLVVFGEVGLAGEIRPVPSGQERISEPPNTVFKRAIVPYANMPKKPLPNMQVFGVKKLADALAVLEGFITANLVVFILQHTVLFLFSALNKEAVCCNSTISKRQLSKRVAPWHGGRMQRHDQRLFKPATQRQNQKPQCAKSLKLCTVSSGWSFPAVRKKSAWCLVNFTRCIPAISI